MPTDRPFNYLTVGTSPELVENLWDLVARGNGFEFSHLVHPSFNHRSWPEGGSSSRKYFFSPDEGFRLPIPDRGFLASLEGEGIPTLHNMILGDRVVSKLPYREALAYATFLAKRLIDVFEQSNPMAIIGGFDSLHSSLALAVSRRMKLPWSALHFSVIPDGLACFCDRLTPSSRVQLQDTRIEEVEELAVKSLRQFESRELVAPAYIAPVPRSMSERVAKILNRLSTLRQMLRKESDEGIRKFTEPRSKYSAREAVLHLRRTAEGRRAVAKRPLLARPPADPYVLFGLHMQPESSIDVWAPFFSNQMWVIELLSRSIPPTHRFLVKVHKSDAARYSNRELDNMGALPGVELVAPFADTRSFVENAGLIVLIQGTMGLEAALIGKPVIMLGDSPFAIFPNVTQIEEITGLPELIREKLREQRPSRSSIIGAYTDYLRPFAPASTNDWTKKREPAEIDRYWHLFDRLRAHVIANSAVAARADRNLQR
jgi:hypothetical protein